MDRYLVVLTGAGLGGLMRYLTIVWIMERFAGRFPLGTFLVNLSGSFLVGVMMTMLTERFPDYPNIRFFLVVGVLGGYTTFSSFEYETWQAARSGDRWMGLFYVVSSVVLGYLAVWLGTHIATRR